MGFFPSHERGVSQQEFSRGFTDLANVARLLAYKNDRLADEIGDRQEKDSRSIFDWLYDLDGRLYDLDDRIDSQPTQYRVDQLQQRVDRLSSRIAKLESVLAGYSAVERRIANLEVPFETERNTILTRLNDLESQMREVRTACAVDPRLALIDLLEVPQTDG